jgi:hypothetical protein
VTEIAHVSSSGGAYAVAVFSPSSSAGSYRLTFTR